MKLTDIDTIFGETLAKLDATLATADVTVSALLGEEIDAYIADIAALKLEAIDDLEVLLAKTATPTHPAASTAPLPPATGTVKISVRVPGRILAAIKTRAAERRHPYQRVLNQVLRDAVRTWEPPAGTTGHV